MRHVLAVLVLAACSGGESGPTAATFEKVAEDVHAMQPWAEAQTDLEAALGEPMSTEGDQWVWQTTGDPCTQLTVTRMGEVVGTVTVAPCP